MRSVLTAVMITRTRVKSITVVVEVVLGCGAVAYMVFMPPFHKLQNVLIEGH